MEFTNIALEAQIEYPLYNEPCLKACDILIFCAICLDIITSNGYENVQLANPEKPPDKNVLYPLSLAQ